MVGLFQHLGRSVQNRPHFFIALILEWLLQVYWHGSLHGNGLPFY